MNADFFEKWNDLSTRYHALVTKFPPMEFTQGMTTMEEIAYIYGRMRHMEELICGLFSLLSEFGELSQTGGHYARAITLTTDPDDDGTVLLKYEDCKFEDPSWLTNVTYEVEVGGGADPDGTTIKLNSQSKLSAPFAFVGTTSASLSSTPVTAGNYCLAGGNSPVIADTFGGIAWGDHATVTANYGYAFGHNVTAAGNAIATGFNSTASDYSAAFGSGRATGLHAICAGDHLSDVSGQDGETYEGGAAGNYSACFNRYCATAPYSEYSFACGYRTVTTGQASFASGYQCQAGSGSFVTGQNCYAHGTNSFCAGNQNESSGSYSATFGHCNKATESDQFVIGKYSAETDAIFAIGDGEGTSTAQRSNCFEVSTDGVITTGDMAYTNAVSPSITSVKDALDAIISRLPERLIADDDYIFSDPVSATVNGRTYTKAGNARAICVIVHFTGSDSSTYSRLMIISDNAEACVQGSSPAVKSFTYNNRTYYCCTTEQAIQGTFDDSTGTVQTYPTLCTMDTERTNALSDESLVGIMAYVHGGMGF